MQIDKLHDCIFIAMQCALAYLRGWAANTFNKVVFQWRLGRRLAVDNSLLSIWRGEPAQIRKKFTEMGGEILARLIPRTIIYHWR